MNDVCAKCGKPADSIVPELCEEHYQESLSQYGRDEREFWERFDAERQFEADSLEEAPADSHYKESADRRGTGRSQGDADYA